jgi:hypothetical protein
VEINKEEPIQLYTVAFKLVWRTVNAGFNWAPITEEIASGISIDAAKVIGIGSGTNPTIYIDGPKGFFYRIDNVRPSSPGREVNLRSRVPNNIKGSLLACLDVNPNKDSEVFVALSDYSTTQQPRIYRVEMQILQARFLDPFQEILIKIYL